MKIKNKKLCFNILMIFASSILISNSSWAKNFHNSYLAFEIPDAWDCKLENTEWICRAKTDKEAKEAIIVLTAKEVGPMDTFDAYTSHLANPQPTSYKGAVGVSSKVVYPPKKVLINDQAWIDGLHNSSEVPNYFTRYLATTKDRIAILFTCSAYKDYYTKYSQDFFKAVQSLRVIATKDLLNQANNGVQKANESLGPMPGMKMPDDLLVADDGGNGGKGAGGGMTTKSLFMGLALVLLAIGIYMFMKSRKK